MAVPIGESWTRIIAWLRVNAPADCVEVFTPVTRDTIASTAAQMGIVFPDQLIEFYQRLDGAEVGTVLPSPDGDDTAFTPMPLQDIHAEWMSQRGLVEIGQFDDCTPRSAAEIQSVWWSTGWIPFATNGGGDYLCVDIAPTATGRVGQIITHSHETGVHRLLAPSLADYLEDLALKLEQGEFVHDDKYGVIRASSATEEMAEKPDDMFMGMTEWHYANALEAGEAAFKQKDYALCVAHLERFESRLEKLPSSRLAFARKQLAQPG